jgi:glycosyltransferase involved in cell wall biosynthesis
MTAIHQLVSGYTHNDAISNEARVLRRLLRSWGVDSHIYCDTRRILPELRKDARDFREAANDLSAEDAVILHLSIGSEVNRVFPRLPGGKLIVYHNITPPAFFRGYRDDIAHELDLGLRQARELAGSADRAFAVSRFNAGELEALGHRDVGVLPLLLDPAQWEGPVDRAQQRAWKDGSLNVLFVGRCAPNKRIEDLLFALHYLQRYGEPSARLIHVGSSAGLERYEALLRTKARSLGLERVVFAGSVPQRSLRAAYAAADVFLCLSEHEGFCIPLLEAMASDLPVIAYAAGAVPETLDGAGALLHTKDFGLIAELITRLHRDPDLRHGMITAQRKRLQRFDRSSIEQQWREALTPWLART